jgi:SAM-dependent methyltransferase
MKSPYDKNPGFYEDDNRRNRGFNPVTKQFLETKYSVLLPPDLVRNKRLLDLGACCGAAGQWALFYGATQYTGVEIQDSYARKARQLLTSWGHQAKIVQRDIRSFLNHCTPESYDIVLVAGVLYLFIDPKQFIDAVCQVAKDEVVVETSYPRGMREGKIPLHTAVTEYILDQGVNLAESQESLLGVSATTSLAALDILFDINGFAKNEEKLTFPINPDSVIYDECALGDTQLETRFAVRYVRQHDRARLMTLEDNLPSHKGEKRSWTTDAVAIRSTQEYRERSQRRHDDETGTWCFDSSVAERFSEIAGREIPDYHRVIEKTVRVIKRVGHINSKIIDVGSATGNTLRALYNAGYRNIYGVDNSTNMLSKSFKKATLIHANDFPKEQGPFDFIIANWVLHFISNREEYLRDIRDSLTINGILIITEKVSSSSLAHELYYEIKRDNGVSEQAIQKKRRQIEGVLIPFPLSWYLETFTKLGFKYIDVINANTVFVTFLVQLNDIESGRYE